MGKERRTLHQTSPWIVHIAPCFIDVPTGGLQARHMLKCVTPCRLVAEPASRNTDGSPHSPASSPMAMRAGQVQELDGSPLPLTLAPHALPRLIATSLHRKLVAHRYMPGEELLSAASCTASPAGRLCALGAGRVHSRPDAVPERRAAVPGAEAHDDSDARAPTRAKDDPLHYPAGRVQPFGGAEDAKPAG